MSQVFYPQCRVILSGVFDGFGGTDSDPTIIHVVPKEAQVNLTGYKEADTWSLVFDAKAFPFSPDIIRAVNVEIYMFDAESVNPTLERFATAERMLVAGISDNAEMHLSKDGREFSLDGRDYTALLIDKRWDQRVAVPTGRPISQIAQELVDVATNAPAHGGRTLTVEYASSQPEPVVGQYRAKTTKKGKPVKGGETVWDVLYKMCLIEGLVVFVRGFSVVITDPQTLTVQSAAKARKVAYGRNLASLKVSRKLGKERTPQVVVSSYSARLRGSISARFPEEQEPVTTGIGTKKDEQVNFVVQGVEDASMLRRFAEAMYNNLARGESHVSFTTKSLKDLTIEGGGLDMLAMRAGDPVVIGFDPFNGQVMESMSPQERYQYLVSQGYSRAVASLVAVEYDKIDQFRRPFYVRDVGVTWSSKEGISLDVEAVNFVSINRDDVSATSDPARAATKVPKSTDRDRVGR